MGKSIGDILRVLRKSRNLTQQDLAKETRLSASAIKSYESGAREPNSKAMAALETYFNVSGAYLRGEEMISSESAYNVSLASEKALTAGTQMIDSTVLLLKTSSVQVQENSRNMLNIFISLSLIGQKEMLKRVREYKIIEDAASDKGKAPSSKESVG